MTDARFEDAPADAPLFLGAVDAEDLKVIAALVQDAVTTRADMTYDRRHRRFAALLNRFRWEDREAAEREGRPYERVRSLLVINDVMAARVSGLDLADRDLVVSILDLAFAPGADGAGVLSIVLAGDGEIALDVECLDVMLKDVSRPYAAPSGRAPAHEI